MKGSTDGYWNVDSTEGGEVLNLWTAAVCT